MISFWEDNLPNFKYQKNWPSYSHLNPILYWLFKFLYFYQSHSTRNVKVLEHHFIIPRILRGLWISVTSPAKVFKFKRNPWRSGNELIQIREAYPNQKCSFWLILAFQRPIIITQWWLIEGRDLKMIYSLLFPSTLIDLFPAVEDGGGTFRPPWRLQRPAPSQSKVGCHLSFMTIPINMA